MTSVAVGNCRSSGADTVGAEIINHYDQITINFSEMHVVSYTDIITSNSDSM